MPYTSLSDSENNPFLGAEFIKSVSKYDQLPAKSIEIAFVGRSNSGKSSTINTLTNRKNLARVSKTPGRTQTLNFFRLPNLKVNHSIPCFMVDLPGYGFSKTCNFEKKLINYYLSKRKNLLGLILICDIRRGIGELDHQLLEFVNENVRIHLILNKADKISFSRALEALKIAKAVIDNLKINSSLEIFSNLNNTFSKKAQIYSIVNNWINFSDLVKS